MELQSVKRPFFDGRYAGIWLVVPIAYVTIILRVSSAEFRVLTVARISIEPLDSFGQNFTINTKLGSKIYN
ncbi:hypothetical protein CHELA20_40048 [Hyphomicrobiales bacterium]|nr:hypothetical protein CHELA20_40048 [Hyphomicrobiales bacterium]CAH1687604.1 hypothetical protein CHELA41_40048 [Hyphomicrobiales bacterium]